MKRPSPVSRYTYAPCGACGQRKPCLRLESEYGETFTCNDCISALVGTGPVPPLAWLEQAKNSPGLPGL